MRTSREDDTRLHLQLHPMKEEAMGIYKKFHLKLRKTFFPGTGTICSEKLRSLHPYDIQSPAGHGSEQPTVVNTALSRGSN